MYLTEKEILDRQRNQLFYIQKLLARTGLNLDDFCDLLPGIIHLNRIPTFEIVYIDRNGCEKLGLKREEVTSGGMQLLQKIIEPTNFLQLKKTFAAMDFTDNSVVCSYFQAIKSPASKGAYEWYYSVKKQFSQGLTISITNPLSSLGNIQAGVEKVLEENCFIRKNLQKLESLTRRERELMVLISRGHTSQEIATSLCLSPHTIKTHRKHIWQKLDIKSYADLIRFAEHFELL